MRDDRMRCAWIMLPLLLSALSICCLGICTEQHAEQRAPPRAVGGVSARHTSHTRAWSVTHMIGPHTSCEPRRTRAAIDLWCAQCACRSRTASRGCAQAQHARRRHVSPPHEAQAEAGMADCAHRPAPSCVALPRAVLCLVQLHLLALQARQTPRAPSAAALLPSLSSSSSSPSWTEVDAP